MNDKQATNTQAVVQQERWQLLRNISDITELPLIGLSFVWLVLLVVDFTQGLNIWLQTLSNVIWLVFVLDFLLKFVIAPHKLDYLRHNWLTVIALVLPAFRLLRAVRALNLLRAARATRAISLLRVLTTVNRGMGATRRLLAHNGIGYVIILTLIVLFAGAAGMAYFESPTALRAEQSAASGLGSYADALWWTGMMITTLGSDYWPQTVEGRILCWLLSLYGFAILGYITATLASFFIGQQAVGPRQHSDRQANEQAALYDEMVRLRQQVALLAQQLQSSSAAAGARLPRELE